MSETGGGVNEPNEEVLILRRQVLRQKAARKQAESILEQKSYELYQVNQTLQESIARLDQRVADRTAALTAARDLSEEGARQLERVNARFARVAEASGAGIWEINLQNKEIYCSPKLAQIFGLSIPETTYRLKNYHLFKGAGSEEVNKQFGRINNSGTPVDLECQIVVGDGSPHWFKLNALTHKDNNGKPLRLTGAFFDINETVKNRLLVEHMATHDTLTKVANRALFNENLEIAIKESKESGELFCVVIADLNAFKEINDTYGHGAGDQLLRHVADSMQAVVGNTGTVARLGGDEFAVILRDTRNAENVRKICEKIVARCTKPILHHDVEISIHISLGVSTYPADGRNIFDLARHADLAMYHGKRAGNNESGFCFFSSEIDAKDREAREIKVDIRRAIGRQDFILHYQPKYNILTSRMEGVEALIRWPREDGSFTPPDEFIPHAEENGLINELSAWIIDEGCRQAAEWHRQGLAIPIALNMSPVQFANGDLPYIFQAALRHHSLPGEMIGIEITENCFIEDENLGQTNNQLKILNELGIEISIDDFGTGYSSLSYLHQLPIQVIKIDRSFIAQLFVSAEGTAIVDAIIKLSHALGKTLVAEGVETQEQLAWLREKKCESAQGYYFSPALSPIKILELVRQNK